MAVPINIKGSDSRLNAGSDFSYLYLHYAREYNTSHRKPTKNYNNRFIIGASVTFLSFFFSYQHFSTKNQIL